MAERHSTQSDDGRDERPRDPFAELALIIGFDPRQKIRGPAAAALEPAAAAGEQPPPEEAVEAGEPEPANAMPDETETSDEAGASHDAAGDWDELLPLEFDLQESEEAAAAPSEAPVERRADDAWAEDDSHESFMDEESWQRAVAASLDRITGEINEQGASREPSRLEPAAQLAPEPGAPEVRDPLDEELSIEAEDWNLLGLGALDEGEPSAGPYVRESSDEPSAPEIPVNSAEPTDDPFEDVDLDAVLAQSIERELEVAWSEDIAAAVQVPEEAVQAQAEPEAQRLEPQAPADRAEPEAYDLEFDDFDLEELDEPEFAAAPEPMPPQDEPASAQPDEEEVTADDAAPEFAAFDLDEPRFEAAPEPVAASGGAEAASELQVERQPEADFEAELAALLAEDDEPTIAAPAAVAESRPVPAPQARDLSATVEAMAPESPAAPAPMQVREPAGPAREEFAPPARSEPTRPAQAQAAREPAEDDPFAALAAMAARYRSGGAARPFIQTQAPEPKAPEPAPPKPEAAPPPVEQRVEPEDPVEAMRSQPPSRHEMPEIETVDVPEPATALADDLDIPEVPVERPRAARAPFDDLDTEFAELLQEMTEGRRAERPAPSFRPTWETKSPRAPMAQDFSPGSPQHEPHGYAAPNAAEMFDPDEHAAAAGWRHADEERDATDAQAAEAIEGFEQEDEEPAARGRGRRGFWLASLLAGVVLAGGVGAYAVGSGGIAISGAPALVKADAGPVKVKPKDPGGAKVPNQDNKVYQRVAGGPLDTPTQAKLVASAEEPVSLVEPTPPADDLSLDLGGDSVEALVKIDERFSEPAEAEAEPSPVQEEAVTVVPRKVRTMAVRADGTLVPNDEIPPAEAPQALVEPQVAAAQDAIRKVSGAAEAQSVAPDVAATGAIPETAQQPAPVAVAALQPGAWSMQIASQPSEDGARNAYKDLAERFGGVLGSRGVNIVKAEIEGKGTFWRVRIPAETRNDAVSLCESYKAAGGSCFVSK
ncbi:MAG TPA: SPOR domain-containing protein [Mesorhizobium sp.]|jgi:hypothetical protein|nr:SPOR domain-containing protein [Mesorhizobium sp.]